MIHDRSPYGDEEGEHIRNEGQNRFRFTIFVPNGDKTTNESQIFARNMLKSVAYISIRKSTIRKYG